MALLIIDELGFKPMDRGEASPFFRLVRYRMAVANPNRHIAGLDPDRESGFVAVVHNRTTSFGQRLLRVLVFDAAPTRV